MLIATPEEMELSRRAQEIHSARIQKDISRLKHLKALRIAAKTMKYRRQIKEAKKGQKEIAREIPALPPKGSFPGGIEFQEAKERWGTSRTRRTKTARLTRIRRQRKLRK